MESTPAEPLHTCDVGGCDDPGEYTFGKWNVCAYHFAAYLDDAFDLDVYFQIFETKVLGLQPRPVDEAEFDPDEIEAYLDFLSDSENEGVGDWDSVV